jgi:hypothetical protein
MHATRKSPRRPKPPSRDSAGILCTRLDPMIRQIAPQFFATDIPSTVAYYKDKLGFECLGTWQDPPVYAIVARDGHAIHFRCAEPPSPNPEKYADELLDAYLFIEDADGLYAEYAARGVQFTRGRQHAMGRTRVCGEGLRRPAARLRRESVVSKKSPGGITIDRRRR